MKTSERKTVSEISFFKQFCLKEIVLSVFKSNDFKQKTRHTKILQTDKIFSV
jgi:hypothetical protein